MSEPHYCEYEVSAFQCCKRKAVVRIERNGYFCRQHASKIKTSLLKSGLRYEAENIKKEKN